MIRRMAIALGALFAILATVFAIKFWPMISGKGFGAWSPPPVTVSAAAAERKPWQPLLEAVATLTPVNGVYVAAEVAGIVKSIHFRNGDTVRRGTLLVQLDDTADQAELKGLEAELANARREFERTRELVERNLVSESSLDEVRTRLERAEAAVESKRALIDKKAIRAPFDGTLGIREVNVGQYLTAGTAIVSLQDLTSLYATFSLPQQNLRDLRIGQKVEITVDTWPEARFEGRLIAIDSAVDPDTRTIRGQAMIANTKRLLRPGMYATARITLPVLPAVVVVPRTAISYSLYGDSVYLIREETGTDGKPVLKAFRQFVRLGEERDDEVIVVEGVKAGDRVVTAGHLKLQDGATVVIDDSVALSAAK